MAESKSQIYYFSFDLNTKDQNFYPSLYSDIKKFMISNGFKWSKDSNYVSNKPIKPRHLFEIQLNFRKAFCEHASCMNKLDWSIHSEVLSLRAMDLMKNTSQSISLEKTIYRRRHR